MALSIMGDQLEPTTGSHGADIASQRIDDLDRECLRFALERAAGGGTAVNLGCGYGAQGFRLGCLGVGVWMFDLLDLSAPVELFNGVLRLPRPVHYRQKDVVTLEEADLPGRFDILYSQRFLHYLPFDVACRVLALVAGKMPPEGRAFLSASGIGSELGVGYPHAARPVEARYAALERGQADKHHIREPVCLYSEADLVALCARAGLRPVSTHRSTFGNVRGVFGK